MNPRLSLLQAYPFERLSTLLRDITPPAGVSAIDLSIGEPKHPTPQLVSEALIEHLHGIAQYPKTVGLPALRSAIAAWLRQRFALPGQIIDPERHILPVNGTREALFSIAQAIIAPCAAPRQLVLSPNPFYQIYEGAALLAGAEPYFVNIGTSGQPDYHSIATETWARTKLLYICSPNNPTGAFLPIETLQYLIELSLRHDFVIAADECYSEIYLDDSKAPPSLLQAAAQMGHDSLKNCLVFHSLSKRSNMPGARSGFVAGDADLLQAFLQYRTYLGNATPPFIQSAAIAAWQDETHVRKNRLLYQQKFEAVLNVLEGVLPLQKPAGAFYLWPEVGDGETFARELYAQHNIRVLPGAYLSRPAHGHNPGQNRVRIALVAPLEECVEAAYRIRRLLEARAVQR